MTESDIKTMKVGVLLNTTSGNCDPTCEAEMSDLLAEYEIIPVATWCGGASIFGEALDDFKQQKIEVLVVLGGDGTIRTAIEHLGSVVSHVIPLPGGTMNMLPKALYGTLSWKEALRATIENPTTKAVAAGTVDQHLFFVAAVFGGVSALTPAREAIRDGNIIDATRKGFNALIHAFDHPLSYRLGSALEEQVDAIAVMCPLTSRVLSDEAPVLEMITLNLESFTSLLRLASAAAFAEWRGAQEVISLNITEVRISSQEDISAVLDGEIVEYGSELIVTLVPKAFTALVPLPKENAPEGALSQRESSSPTD